MDDYCKGYIDSVCESQLHPYSCYLLEVLADDFIIKINAHCRELKSDTEFQLSNYQVELAENLGNEEALVMYENMEDACAKADFYLRHENFRKQIARNGYER